MASDSHLFLTRDELESAALQLEGNVFRGSSETYLPLYEGKMVHHWHHRFGDYALATLSGKGVRQIPEAPSDVLADPTYAPLSRYWVKREEVDARLAGRSTHQWLLGWRQNGASVDERTLICCVIPAVGAGHSLFLMDPNSGKPWCLLANLAALALDYVCRQKLGGVNLSYFVIEQLPVLSPGSFDKAAAWSGSETVADWIMPRALELTFTSWDVEQFARDLAYVGPPYQWDPNRRFLLRAELDAAFFQLYGIARHDVDHILETFEIIRRQEEQRHSEYRTKRVILEIYDEMADAQRMGRAYRTRLDPPPADPSIAHVVRRRAGGDEGMAAV